MPYMNVDVDIDVNVEEFWNNCAEYEKEELRDLVSEYFDLDTDSEGKTLLEVAIEKAGDLAEGEEAKDFIRRTLGEMEYKLKMRDFS